MLHVAMNKYSVGIIGYGWAAEAHITAINARPRAPVTAVSSARDLVFAADLSWKEQRPVKLENPPLGSERL